MTKNRQKCETLIYILVFTLVFEGIIRKILPSFASLAIFFLKDILCLIGIYFIVNEKKKYMSLWLIARWKFVFLCFCPLLIYTTFLDPFLGLFATKQYLLYVVVALLVGIAFPPEKIDAFKKFTMIVAGLIVPTVLVAMIQNSLPASHWLNRSVGGDSLEHFSAAGHLRVSSTFSFTGQFSWFLNAACGFLMVLYFMPSISKNRLLLSLQKFIPLLIGGFLLVGVFVTGGRTAVLGCGACIVIGGIFAVYKSPSSFSFRGGVAALLLFIFFTQVREFAPQFFAAYEKRASGSEKISHAEEIQQRIWNDLFGWTQWFEKQNTLSIIVGNGLGVMSNGSDKLSSYAYGIRSKGMWTEADFPTTAWEGGIYLIILWYGFRFSIIFLCFRYWLKVKNKKYAIPISFLLANVLINGVLGTLGIQPPVAIWWWLSVGSIGCIYNFDKINFQRKRFYLDRKSIMN